MLFMVVLPHPRREAYSRSSDSCISGLCPLHVETLAYRATRMSILPRVAGGELSLSIIRNSAESQGGRQPMLLHVMTQILAILCAALVFQKVRGAEKLPGLSTREAFRQR